MRLVVDASVLVAEALRSRGRALISRPELELFVAASAWSEALHELRRRAAGMDRSRHLTSISGAAMLVAALAAVEPKLTRVAEADYQAHEAVARSRIPRDPDDWPTVAAALAVGADIWTNDADFLGCGIATWTTETLLAHLSR